VTTLSAANVQDLTREFQSLKDSRDTADRKIQDLENENKFLRDHLVAGQHREEILQKRNQELIDKLDILDHELALANMRRTEEEDLIDIDRSMMTFQLDGDFPPLPALVPLPDQTQHTPLLEEQQKQITGYEEEVRELKEKLDIATEDATAKSQLIESLEILLKEKNELLLLGDQETSKLKDKIIQMTVALKVTWNFYSCLSSFQCFTLQFSSALWFNIIFRRWDTAIMMSRFSTTVSSPDTA